MCTCSSIWTDGIQTDTLYAYITDWDALEVFLSKHFSAWNINNVVLNVVTHHDALSPHFYILLNVDDLDCQRDMLKHETWVSDELPKRGRNDRKSYPWPYADKRQQTGWFDVNNPKHGSAVFLCKLTTATKIRVQYFLQSVSFSSMTVNCLECSLPSKVIKQTVIAAKLIATI